MEPRLAGSALVLFCPDVLIVMVGLGNGAPWVWAGGPQYHPRLTELEVHYMRDALAHAGKTQQRISATVTGDFGNVTDFGRMLACANGIVDFGSI